MSEKKYWETPEFLKLRDEWYKKVEDIDIEDHRKGVKEPCWSGDIYVPTLKRSSYEIKKTYREDTEDYFRLAAHYLYDGRFKSKTERYVWERHADGLKIPQIMNERTKSRLNPMTYWQIHRVICRLRETMLSELKPQGDDDAQEDK